MTPELQPLGEAIFEATQKAFLKLFENGEHYYYCVLLTTGEALPPCIAAWSEEALERFVKEESIPEEEIPYYKYSFADSPYYAFGYEEYFQQVVQLFEQRDSLMNYNNEEQWNEEYNLRLAAMVYAMKKLDETGIFVLNQPREQVYINVELMPPDDTRYRKSLVVQQA
ncbi:DUF4303 domain-containing protein [uncultured Capnocytophaga sp.]|uniref:DUF4303 domain-containing protein n=1 Tax=uncultured Capnocytophaga sp. TaxID=159273 RepID=UPI00261E6E58|nr:DUF4303 domain-containing protein [uncultured Capnocytophaga sp.]